MAEDRTQELIGGWQESIVLKESECLKNIHTIYVTSTMSDGTVSSARVYHRVDNQWISEPTQENNQCT